MGLKGLTFPGKRNRQLSRILVYTMVMSQQRGPGDSGNNCRASQSSCWEMGCVALSVPPWYPELLSEQGPQD